MTARTTTPSWSLLRQQEKYVNSHHTDIRKTFQRVQAEQDPHSMIPALTASIELARAKKANKK